MLPSPTLPTPVRRAGSLGTATATLWIKNDGLAHPTYGGNKVRKVVRILDEVRARGTRRILTFGAAGSHHVLTTALFGRAAGLSVAAVVLPQPASLHAEQTLRAAIAQGLETFPARSRRELPIAIARAMRFNDAVVAPGGSTATGTSSYVDAVGELALQIAAGDLPAPDVIVVPFGSGGTAAGILAGVLRHALPSRVVAVSVTHNPLGRAQILAMAALAARKAGVRASPSSLWRRLVVDARRVGAGYGHATPASREAQSIAEGELELVLDTTYTAKAFAGALEIVHRASAAGAQHVLYWHTLSAAPLEPLLERAPELAPELQALFRQG
ncbi:MAG TPA: pyridoxal-phosphate dependent enzyme [Polyangiaceae bacterium]